MSNQKKNSKPSQASQPKLQATAHQPGIKNLSAWLMIAIVIISGICFSPALKHELTNWDDPVYVTENPLIRSLDADSVKTLFNPSASVSLNYHPVTMLTLAMNYSSSGLDAKGYILTNIVIHILGSLLVFIFIRMLTRGRVWIAGIVALLFAVHPMHVESVVWVSERKDVLYVFFFMAGLISYLKYLDTKKLLYIVAALLLFVLSCLSKAMAVVFPLILLLLDYYLARKITLKAILEKAPFFIISLLIGIHAAKIQATGAISGLDTFSLWERIVFASYGFVNYIAKLFAPVNLSAFYPYEYNKETGELLGYYNIMPLLALVVPALLIICYKKNRELFKVVLFGIGFYFIAVALVLQFISVGNAVMADRYTYLSYIGLFFILGWLADKHLIEKRKTVPAIVLVAASTIILAALCRERVKVWESSGTLWTDVIEKYPHQAPVAYKNRSLWYLDQQQVDKAYNDLIVMSQLPHKDPTGYNNLGNIYGMRQEHAKALEAYNQALKLDSTIFDAHLNSGITYSILKQYDNAVAAFQKAERLDPNSPKLFANRGHTYFAMGKYEQAIKDYDKAIMYDQRDPMLYFYRGLAKFNLAKHAEANADFEAATRLNPSFADAYHNLSITNKLMGNVAQAYQAELKAKSLGFNSDPAYLEGLRVAAGQ